MDVLLLVVVFLVTVFTIGVWDLLKDRQKNLFHLPGPIPLPFLGLVTQYPYSTLTVFTSVGNALLFAKPHEFFISTCNEVNLK